MAYIETFNSKMDWANTLVRTGNFPIDRSSIFSSYDDAVEYAKGTATDSRGLGATSYIGQIITVYDDVKVKVYIINKNRELEPVGADEDITNKINSMPFVKGDADNSAVLDGEYEENLIKYSNKAISQLSVSLGAATTAGLKGWYYSKVEFGSNPVITLSDKQPKPVLGNLTMGAWTSETPNIKAGDKISIVNNAKYDYCGEVKSISGNKITLKSALPFDTLDVGNIPVNNPDDWTIYLPDRPDAGIIDIGGGALAEGVNTKATNIGSHAEGIQTHAYGQYSHTEGFKTEAGYAAHAEGKENIASGQCSHTEGQDNTSAGNVSHTEGRGNYVQSSRGHAEGENNYVGNTDRDTPEATNTSNKGFAAHVEGQANTVIGNSAHAEGLQNKAIGNNSHAEGESTTASGQAAHAEGKGTSTGYTLGETTYVGTNSHAEGENTIAARGSHAEGIDTKAYGWQSHAEGKNTIASANFAHTEGEGTKASASRTHAEGYNTNAISQAAHSEGINTIAGKSDDGNGNLIKPTVSTTTTEGYFSHAEGNGTLAYGNSSHAEGKGTITNNIAEHASGLYNLSTAKTSDNTIADATQFSIGIGTKNERKNAFEVKQNGDIYITGITERLQDKLNICPIENTDIDNIFS